MLLSFSVPEMLPYLRAGVRAAAGQHVAERVKRQTIRKLGPRAEKLLAMQPFTHTIPYSLHLWWKSRTPQREMIGCIEHSLIYKINILHSTVTYPGGASHPVCRLDGPCGWRGGDATLFWSPGDSGNGFAREAYADGFDSPEAFRDFFVPNLGDRFDAILFKW